MDAAKDTPQQTRATDTLWVSQCNLVSLQARLPLSWPTPPDLPPSPKKRYRSAYRYPWPDELADPQKVLASPLGF